MSFGFGFGFPKSAQTPGGATLNLQFAGATALDPRITFTRASSATYFDASGVLTTAANNEARFDHNPSTLAPLGLLIEEQRTNLVTYSEQFDNAVWTKTNSSITANTVVAPDGTLTGDKLIPNNGVAGSYSIQNTSITNGTSYTYTIYAKAGEFTELRLLGQSTGFGSGVTNQTGIYDLSTGVASVGNGAPTVSMDLVGNGWYRCRLTVTATATTSDGVQIRIATTGNGTSGIYIWGAQLEAGAFPTSYIPTTSAQVTRAADLASMTGTNFSSWYNQTEGTLFVDGSTYITYAGANQFPWLAQIDDGTLNNRFQVLQRVLSTYTDASYNVIVGGVSQASFDTNTNNGASNRAVAIKLNDFAFVVGGVVQNTDTSGTVPTVNRLLIGQQDTSNLLNGTIRRIAYYPRRLSNSELQALTS